MRKLVFILILGGCISALSAQTYHSFVAETEIGYAGPRYGVTAAIRPGYELKHRHFLLHLTIGVGYTFTILPMPDYDETTPAIDSEQYRLLAHAYYTDRVDKQQSIEGQISLMVGGEWQEKIYFLVGAIPAFRVYGKNDISANIRVAGEYEEFIDFFENMPNHGFTTTPYSTTAALPFATSLYAAAEIGVPIGEHIRLGLYGRYPALAQATPATWSAGLKLTALVSWQHKKHYPCRCILDYHNR